MATPFNPEKINELQSELIALRDEIRTFEASKSSELLSVPSEKQSDMRNLIHFMAFRQHDVSEIRQKLRLLGLNPFGEIETDVLGQLTTIIRALRQMFPELPEPELAEQQSKSVDSSSGIELTDFSGIKMRTLPFDSAHNYQILLNLLKEGTNIGRIPTWANDPDKMLKMIHNLQRAAAELKINCQVMIDLEDTTIRIGEFEHFSPAIKIEPERNEKGQVIRKAVVFFVLPDYKQSHLPFEIPIECAGYKQLKSNDVVYLRDSAERSRKMIISEVGKGFIKAETDKTVYLDKGIRIMFIRKSEIIDHATIGKIPSKEVHVTVQKGDAISLLPPGMPGQSPVFNSKGELLHPARISCSSLQVFKAAKAGQRIFFGKKKMEGLIREVSSTHIQVLITRANPSGNCLFSGKRIYFPDSLNFREELAEADFKNIELAVKQGSIICISAESDLKLLQDYYSAHSLLPKGLVLKTGSVGCLEMLPQQLIEGLKINLAGVWIRQKEITLGQSPVQVDEAVAEITRWCRAARIAVIRT